MVLIVTYSYRQISFTLHFLFGDSPLSQLVTEVDLCLYEICVYKLQLLHDGLYKLDLKRTLVQFFNVSYFKQNKYPIVNVSHIFLTLKFNPEFTNNS